MTDEHKKWVIGNDMRDEEFDREYTRLVGLFACGENNRARTKKAWIDAKRPPIITFIRQNG